MPSGRGSVAAEDLELDVGFRSAGLDQALEARFNETGRTAQVVDGLPEIGSGFFDQSRAAVAGDPPRPPGPRSGFWTRQRPQDPELWIVTLQRFQFLSIDDFVDGAIAVDEADRNR